MIIGKLIANEFINLQSSNARIILHNLVKSKQVMIETSNSPIETSEIYSKEFTRIRNINGPVIGNYSIENELRIRTTNAIVDAKISLISINDEEKGEGKDFQVDVKSSNGRVDVVYLDQPKDSYLDSKVVTWNQIAKVSYHPQFEGSYAVSISLPLFSPSKIWFETDVIPISTHYSYQLLTDL